MAVEKVLILAIKNIHRYMNYLEKNKLSPFISLRNAFPTKIDFCTYFIFNYYKA